MRLKMTLKRLILHTNVVGDLTKSLFYFCIPKTSESQRFSNSFNWYRKETSKCLKMAYDRQLIMLVI